MLFLSLSPDPHCFLNVIFGMFCANARGTGKLLCNPHVCKGIRISTFDKPARPASIIQFEVRLMLWLFGQESRPRINRKDAKGAKQNS